jgi:ornithine carbamoyltransferase
VSFEVGVAELGGTPLHLTDDLQLGRGEPLRDTAYVLSSYLHAIMIRTFGQAIVEELAEHASIPVVNGLTDEEHPCQALADCLTLLERWDSLEGRTIAFIGDGNNVAASLAQAAAMLGARVIVASPAGFELAADVSAEVMRIARFGGGVAVTNDPFEAVAEADAVYTDVWASMGQESEAADRSKVFRPFQVNARLMAAAPVGALFMHCLPAHRGDEVTDDIIDSPLSVVFDQSENRLHTQKALLSLLSGA